MRRFSKTTAMWATLGVIIWAAASPARAGDRDHIGGFFLRMSLGGGSANTEITGVSDSAIGLVDQLTFSGAGGDYNFAVGAMIAPNLALHGTFWGWVLSGPDTDFDGQNVGTLDGDVSLSAIGGGITYYIMPANVYLSGSVGAGTLSIAEFETDMGIAFDVTLGKEWWVGRKWGLGGALDFGYHSIADSDVDQNWTGLNFGVRFSATMN